MKKFWAFFKNLFSFLALLGVALYCIAFFFASKAKRLNELFSKSESPDDTEEHETL